MTDKTREAFEAFVSSELGDVAVADEGRYISPKIQNYWLAWQAATARAMAEAVRAPDAVAALADAFERSADWLDKGVLHGPKRTHPLVGTADYRKAAALLRSMKKEGKP